MKNRGISLVLALLAMVGCGGSADGGNQDGESSPTGGQSGSAAGAGSGGSVASGGHGDAGDGSAPDEPDAGGSAGLAGSSGSGGSAGSVGGASGESPVDPGSGSCQEFTPCGGDLVGVWNVSICMDPPFGGFEGVCEDVDYSLTMDGEMDFRADGTLSSTVALRSVTKYGPKCVAQFGGCGPSSPYLKECVAGPDGICTCEAASETAGSPVPYSTEGSRMTSVRDGKTSYAFYCRQGDEVWMRAANAEGDIFVYHLTQ